MSEVKALGERLLTEASPSPRWGNILLKLHTVLLVIPPSSPDKKIFLRYSDLTWPEMLLLSMYSSRVLMFLIMNWAAQ